MKVQLSNMSTDGGEGVVRRTILVVTIACVATLLTILQVAERQQRLPRTRTASRYHDFYCRMRDAEFRAVFRVPRPLFDAIVADLRPMLQYRWAVSAPILPRYLLRISWWCSVIVAGLLAVVTRVAVRVLPSLKACFPCPWPCPCPPRHPSWQRTEAHPPRGKTDSGGLFGELLLPDGHGSIVR